MISPVAAMVLPSATAAAAAPASSSSLRNLSPLTVCLPPHCRRSSPFFIFPTVISCFSSSSPLPLRLPRRSKNPGIACQATIDTEPEGNNEDKEKGATGEIGEGTSSHAANGIAQDNGHLDYNSVSDKEKNESDSVELSTIHETSQLNERDPVTPQGIQEKDDDLDVASGSPLPGMKQLGETIRIPKGTIDILKDQVFGFDTFFVTSQEPYEGGVLFNGNLRGKAAKSYEKITKRLQERFGDQYKLFLLINPEDEKPVAVVVPKQTLQPDSTAVPEWFAAGAFGLVTIFTLLLRNVPALQANMLSTFDNLELLKDGLPGALVTILILASHEIGHILVARDTGIKLGVPYFVPSWQMGSFGAITRIASIVANREDLLKLAAAGPLAGFSIGLVLLLLGFLLPPSDGIGIVVDPAVFHESFLAGGIAKLLLGDALKEGSPLSLNPLVLWAWTGLLINAINSIPAGELDGGRIAFALWGRKASARWTAISLALLGISSLFNDVAFYWVVLIFILQRGPIAPLSEEITEPENKHLALGVAVLVLGLLICVPYPFPFTTEELSF
ncbi:probable zinc metalloprotease EGY2, chloroplastic isoform X2 [Ananas comosus]|uniref:Probable zinc metalloprotease EGY2, chloroplastic isoform X2 n=1 Tax=Ananas comosus TaxID=4615 RepID=A0A6P5EZ87_ANACO|nr:probable zinc metalloprotease EGY2, chloroplastic isoform X2 [Ananas comosus]